MQLDYFICSPEELASDAVIFFVEESEAALLKLKSDFAKFNNPQIEIALNDFWASHRETRFFYHKIKNQNICVQVVGLGKPDKIDCETLRKASATSAKEARKSKAKSIAFYLPDLVNINPEETAVSIIEGAVLALYKFDKYKSKKQDRIERLTLSHSNPETTLTVEPTAQKAFDLCHYVNLARDLGNAPASELNPSEFAKIITENAKSLQIDCEIVRGDALSKSEFVGLNSVGKGSSVPPIFAILKYEGGRPGEKPIVLIGKGVTFDSGGLNIKTGSNMEYMHIDMHGAATALCATLAVAQAKIPINVICLLPICENLINGKAYKPHDILCYPNGKSVEANDTDAEGRLILADALIYAQKYNPQAVIDLATLTGSVVVAFGFETAALFSNNEDLSEKLLSSAGKVRERLWRMPLYDEYKEYIKSENADIKNYAGRWGGVCTAAAFLNEFVGDFNWAHIDIASTAIVEKEREYITMGASGYGVRLLFDLLKNWNKK